MEPSRFESFGNLLRATAEMQRQGGIEITEMVFRMWVKGLQDWSYSEVESAFSRFLLIESRMPTLRDIVRILRGSEEELALSALIKVEKAMSRHGSYSTVVFDDPIIHAVVDELGGWIKCCRVTDKELTWWEKDFRERYRHHLCCGVPADVPSRLLGILDETNLPYGAIPQKPVVIGDYEKAIGWVSKLENPDFLSLDQKKYSQKNSLRVGTRYPLR